ncbi:MaoC/PaaZ C-terminal domain-containing protein [Roseovarius sp.]|uniref:MaoC/PaaZ C-terminal domain-containing protein n=1 Tax=Roseovarius sp. TaxID=1486281 RepID=UPI003563A84E
MKIEKGARYLSQARTVTETDIVNFCGLSGDFTPVHSDAEFARTTPFGERMAHGPLVLSVAIGLATASGLFGDRVIGLVNCNWDFAAPVRIGDTIHSVVEVESLRPSSKPSREVATYRFDVRNQRDESVQQGHLIVVLRAAD